MKFTKKNAFAIGAAVMMTVALATFASASTPASSSVLVNMNEDSLWVEAVDVDLSTMDFSQVLEGTPIPVGTIDPAAVNGSGTTQAKPAE